MKDRMNGTTNHLGDITTAIAVRARGVVNTATRIAGDIEAGMGATAQAMATSLNIISTMNMPTKGTTKAPTTASVQISQAAKDMEHLTQALTLEVAITTLPLML